LWSQPANIITFEREREREKKKSAVKRQSPIHKDSCRPCNFMAINMQSKGLIEKGASRIHPSKLHKAIEGERRNHSWRVEE